MDTATPFCAPFALGFSRATVGDAMSPLVRTCDPSTPLRTVARRMASEQVHALVVLTAGASNERWPWGVVTGADLLRHADRVDELTAGEAASHDVLLAVTGEPLVDAVKRMSRRAVTHALVVDRATGRPVGVLSVMDVARVLARDPA